MPEINDPPELRIQRNGEHESLSPVWGLRPEALRMVARALFGHADAGELEALRLRGGPDTSTVPGVAVLTLRGIIRPRGGGLLELLFGGGGGALEGFREDFRQAVASDDIRGILINIDSPGGSTDLVAETAAEIRDARGDKPIVAIANTMAASAAYWIASQADELVVTPSGDVGSIGVFAMHDDMSKMDEMMGIKTTLISAGKYKTEANPFEPLTEEAKAALQAMVDDFYGMFVADVAKGRGVSAADVRDGFGEGRMVRARDAVKQKMADRVATFEDTASRLADSRRRARIGSSAGDPPADPGAGDPPPPDNPARESGRALLLARERYL